MRHQSSRSDLLRSQRVPTTARRMRRTLNRVFCGLTLGIAIFGLSACGGGTSNGPQTTYGTRTALGNGTLRSYVTLLPDKTPSAVGVEFTASALKNLPTTATDGHHCFEDMCVGGHESLLDMPTAVRSTPYQWVLFNWNSHGHMPQNVYDVPHFDFHFMIMDQATRDSIRPGACGMTVDCDDFQKGIQPVPAPFLPTGYSDVQAVEAAMGNHLVDLKSAEFNNQPFTHTFIYGAYAGKITFYEPMITMAFFQNLATKAAPVETIPLKRPAAYAQSGYYPTRYVIRYHPDRALYTVSLEGFEYKQAP